MTEQKPAEMGMEVAELMLEKIFTLKQIKENLHSDKRTDIAKISQKYGMQIDRVEKDIYKFENAIKQVIGAKEYNRIAKIYRNKLRAQDSSEPTKDLNNKDEDNTDNKTDNDESVDDNTEV